MFPACLINYDKISIHAPREGGDFIDEVSLIWDNHFNPRPPRGGRPETGAEIVMTNYISIHAPREGGDTVDIFGSMDYDISIHAPREGGDRKRRTKRKIPEDFNPRPPRGGRHHYSKPKP